MSGQLSLETFKALLQDDYNKKKLQNEEANDETTKLRQKCLENSIRNVWQQLGVLPPECDGSMNCQKGYWMRPIPDSIYNNPISTPQTTLVDWNTLPKPTQMKLLDSKKVDIDIVQNGNKSGCIIIEVPISCTVMSTANTGNATLLSQRPVRGNLSDKLTEYTRGIGQNNQLFRPGGLDTNESVTNSDASVDLYRTEEAIARAQNVLDKGSEKSWKDKTIITAPPGANFQAGITWKDSHFNEDSGVDQQETTTSITSEVAEYGLTDLANSSHDLDATLTESSPPFSLTTKSRQPFFATGLFNSNFFDDKSQFGTLSISSSSSDSDDEPCNSVKNPDIEANSINVIGNADSNESGIQNQLSVFMNEKYSEDITTVDGKEIDDLLKEMTISVTHKLLEDKMKRNANDDAKVLSNPLQLAESQLQHQGKSLRKSWATTTLLPISDFDSLIPNPALKFPFTLDDFQQQAIARLERSESVFVAAHTSAGKTVEYAVALAMQRATRCIYTSPIKALSNQKFRDFSLKFGSNNVGLITGDLQVNVDDSTCLIMTTEILRSMLYRGADLIRDIESVIFDEVHYINDSERGVVWEEVIIMLPSYVNLIFLSATTPNTLEFSDWIGRTKRKSVHVIKTNYRPVPLSHHLWAGLKLHKILEGKGPFLEMGYAMAVDGLLPQSSKDAAKKKGEQKGRPPMGAKDLMWQAQGSKQNWMSLIHHLDAELITPTVVFSFSKKKCEEIANMLSSLDLNTAKERSAVMAFTLQSVKRLSDNDAKLPQVLSICEMVQRGIGVHHGGLLPILKEMVEILFSRNLIKVLFATETFAMGVNMPAKAVVFHTIRKHDGTQFRLLEPGEYTQMAGRAGRRGLDTVGTVIICCFGEVPPPQQILRQMLTGSSTKLSSQFRLTYNMILNLLKVEGMSVESMIKRSFSEFATQRALTANEYPQLLKRGMRTLKKLDEQFLREERNRVGAEDLEEYFFTCNKLLHLNSEVFSYIRESDISSFEELFNPGRLVYVNSARQLGAICSPAIVLRPPSTVSAPHVDKEPLKMVCLVLLPQCQATETSLPAFKKPGTIGYLGLSQQRYYGIDEIDLNQIVMVMSGKRRAIDVKEILKVEENPKFLESQSANFTISKQPKDPFSGMQALSRKGAYLITNMKDVEDMQLNQAICFLVESEKVEAEKSNLDTVRMQLWVKRGNGVAQVREACDQISFFFNRMRSYKSHRHPNLPTLFAIIERKETLRRKVETLRHLLSNEALQLFPDFLQRKAVLKRLGYVAENESVCVKGRVACEVNTCEELIVTEMVFEGLLNDLEAEEIVAALSALVFQERNDDEALDSELPERLVKCCKQMKIIAINLGQLQKEEGLRVDPLEYCDKSLRFGLVHVVYEWALGVPFKNICDLTDAQAGSIVRCITRLDELCREVRNCAKVVGNPALYRKLETASSAIKRDIVFASSLYVC